MHLVLPLAAVICVAILSALALILRRIATQDQPAPPADWVENLSTLRYRPMERLLDENDFRYLDAQPGLDAKVHRKLRAQRRSIFRGYLRCLCVDYNRVCFAIRALMAHSEQDRPDLALTLLKQRMTFTLALVRIECLLALHALGLENVEVGGLVGAFDALRLEFTRMAMASAPSAA